MLELERGQRRLLESAYRETVTALASALESKDTGTGEHSQRVHRYAAELAGVVAPELVDDESVTYGFVLHDFPLAFSGVFFGVPLLRWLKARLGRARRTEANHRRSLFEGSSIQPTPLSRKVARRRAG